MVRIKNSSHAAKFNLAHNFGWLRQRLPKVQHLTAKQIIQLRPQWTKEMLIKLAGADGRRLEEPTYILDRIIKIEETEEFKNWGKNND